MNMKNASVANNKCQPNEKSHTHTHKLMYLTSSASASEHKTLAFLCQPTVKHLNVSTNDILLLATESQQNIHMGYDSG